MDSCSSLWWFAWLAVFYRKEFYGKTLHSGHREKLFPQWDAALSARARLTHHTNIYNLSYSHFQSTYSFISTRTPSFPAATALPFPRLPFLIPSLSFHCRCQSCPELSLPYHPSISHFSSPECQPGTVLGKEKNKKSQPGGFSIFSSLSFIISHKFILNYGNILPTYLLLLHFLNFCLIKK